VGDKPWMWAMTSSDGPAWVLMSISSVDPEFARVAASPGGVARAVPQDSGRRVGESVPSGIGHH
jgi:hypothetical protein